MYHGELSQTFCNLNAKIPDQTKQSISRKIFALIYSMVYGSTTKILNKRSKFWSAFSNWYFNTKLSFGFVACISQFLGRSCS